MPQTPTPATPAAESAAPSPALADAPGPAAPSCLAPPTTLREAEQFLADSFARWQRELLGTLRHLLGNQEDALDALQDVFVKCWRKRDELGGVANLRAWIFQVAVNTGRDLRASAWRRRRRPLPGEVVEPTAAARAAGQSAKTWTDADPAAAAERDEQLARLRNAMGLLRLEEREVFLLRQNGEMTYEEIAVFLAVPLGTVKTRMRAALGRLRSALGEE